MLLPLERTIERIYEYTCHEGNYSIVNMLKGARAGRGGGEGGQVAVETGWAAVAAPQTEGAFACRRG